MKSCQQIAECSISEHYCGWHCVQSSSEMEQFGEFNVVSEQVRQLRIGKDLTQDQLAARCSVLGCNLSRGTLAKIEAGIRGVNDVELFSLALVLGVSMVDLFPKDFVRRLKKGRHFDSRKLRKE